MTEIAGLLVLAVTAVLWTVYDLRVIAGRDC